MRRRVARISLRVWFEALLVGLGLAAAARLASMGSWGTALLALCLGGVAAGAGLLVQRRAGDLAMAWRCPRLDALAMRARSRHAPWDALEAADAALASLESCGSYREFFPEARRHLAQAAFRALAAHALASRAREALREAPEGEARARLEEQESMALREIASLAASMRELKARFVAATAPAVSADPTAALRILGEQSGVLAESIDTLHASPELVPLSGGLR